jgi:hypothetical protein
MAPFLLVLCVLVLGTRPSVAQSHGARLHGPGPSQLFAPRPAFPAEARPDTVVKEIPPTHWKRGLLIGGAVGGAALGFLGYALCHDLRETQESCLGPTLGGAAIGAVMGGITGALIGGAFRKNAPTDSLETNP